MTVSNEAVGTLLEVYGVENPFLTGGSHTAAMRAALEAAKSMIASELRTKLAKAKRDIVLLQDTAEFHLSRIDAHTRMIFDMRVENEALRAKLERIEVAAKPILDDLDAWINGHTTAYPLFPLTKIRALRAALKEE